MVVCRTAARVVTVCLSLMLVTAAQGQNRSPGAPAALQPSPDRTINPANFLVESGPFSDPDAGDLHVCTDWEILAADRGERVWSLLCATGVERIRAALSNGTFEGSLAGASALLPQTTYIFRLRHRDDSGDPATEWSPWTERVFTTASPLAIPPLTLGDVPPGTITWRDTFGATVTVPAGASLQAEADGGVLFTINAGGVTNPGPLAIAAPVRLALAAGGAAVSLPASDVAFDLAPGERVTVYLPAIELAAGETVAFWIAFNGSSYAATAGQRDPDFSVLRRAAPASWSVAPGWRLDLAATGFSLPVALEFVTDPGPGAQDPLYYVAELYGTIRVVLRNGEVRTFASGILNFNPNGEFPGAGEQGVGDMAYDPVTGDLFVTYLYSAVDGVDNAPHYPAVDRFTSTDGGLTAATRTRILDLFGETQGQAHYISAITFGPDNQLYVNVGDGFVPETALNPNSFRGKIIRMNRAGFALPDNPFFNIANGINARDYTYSLGVRNPFGGAWRFSDAALYFVENGPSVDRFARAGRGVSFGYDGSDGSMFTNALYNWVPSVAPVNIGFVQPETFGGSGFPAEFQGRAYVSQFGGTFAIGPGNARLKSITEWEIDPSGNLVGGPNAVAIYNGGGASSPVALAVGPDGVYFSDFFSEFGFSDPTRPDANIWRLSWVGLPPPPDCDGDGVSDADELASGEAVDCDGNGVPDACDIAEGRAEDCDRNGVPDSCDVTVVRVEPFNFVFAPWRVNGVATVSGGIARLTTLGDFVAGSLTRPPLGPSPLTDLDIAFDFRIGQGSGADGFSFALYDASIYSGTETFGEQGPGSGNENPAGPGTLVVGFDTFDNGGEGENRVELSVNGAQFAFADVPFDLEDFVWRTARVVLRGGRISVTIGRPGEPAAALFSNVVIPGFQPFVARLGFGGRTGGLTNFHDIDNVAIRVAGGSDGNGNGLPDFCDRCSDADFAAEYGVIDINDILAFADAFDAGAAIADVFPAGGDGGLDINDILTFADLFDAGCP